VKGQQHGRIGPVRHHQIADERLSVVGRVLHAAHDIVGTRKRDGCGRRLPDDALLVAPREQEQHRDGPERDDDEALE
jgi:hypothetical protein